MAHETFLVCFALILILYYFYNRKIYKDAPTIEMEDDNVRNESISNEYFVLMVTNYVPFRSQQQEDVYNISGRVQGRENQQRLSPDAYLSSEHIATTIQMNKPNYNDDPPTYEEAMRIAMMNSLSGEGSTPSVTVVAPKPSTQ